MLRAATTPHENITYTQADSLKVVSLLKKGKQQPADKNMILFFAHELEGTPYVAYTLEVNKQERLVVNLKELDCTTLVENVVALTLAVREETPTWQAFCKHLTQIRYRGGKMNGYSSRNHYFSQWIESNERMGLVREVKGSKADGYKPFVARQKLELNYMSLNSHKYKMLKGRPERIAQIKQYEQESSGKWVRYIPRTWLNRGLSSLNHVHDGDILAIVTKRKGLDTSHLGFAVWGKDGQLHLLNASSVHGKVVLEPMTLWQYMGKHPSQLGVRVVRVL